MTRRWPSWARAATRRTDQARGSSSCDDKAAERFQVSWSTASLGSSGTASPVRPAWRTAPAGSLAAEPHTAATGPQDRAPAMEGAAGPGRHRRPGGAGRLDRARGARALPALPRRPVHRRAGPPLRAPDPSTILHVASSSSAASRTAAVGATSSGSKASSTAPRPRTIGAAAELRRRRPEEAEARASHSRPAPTRPAEPPPRRECGLSAYAPASA